MVPISLDLIGIATKDLATSLRFYRVLGLTIPEGSDGEAHVEATGPGVRIGWDTVELLRQVYGEWSEASGHRIELAFQCSSREDVDATYQRIVEAGFSGFKAPWDAFWGQRYAVVEDPDGNLLSLFA